jgi:hypothetical protein
MLLGLDWIFQSVGGGPGSSRSRGTGLEPWRLGRWVTGKLGVIVHSLLLHCDVGIRN